MCLGIPYRVVKILDEESCLIQVGSGTQHCFIGLVEDLEEGDWVVVHAGFAVEKITEADAIENLKAIHTYLLGEEGGEGGVRP